MVKFLIVRFSSIGDIILTSPVVRHLKTQVQDAEIHYVSKSEYVSILESNPYIDRIRPFDANLNACIKSLKEEGFDYIIDLHNNARTARLKAGLKRMDFTVRKLNIQKWLYVNFKWNRLPDLHMVDRNLQTIRNFISTVDDGGLDYFIPDNNKVDIASLPPEFQKGYIGMAIGAQHGTKKLPVSSLTTLCRKLNYPILILGGPTDKEAGDEIVSGLAGKTVLNTCGKLNINQSASLVEQSQLLITHDTGLMHAGAAFNKKIISIWGNTVPAFGMYPYQADPASVKFEDSGLKCRPCSKIGYHNCPKKHFKCMLEQDLEGIANAANRLVSTTAR